MIPIAALWSARKWLPYAAAGLAGFLLAGALIGVPAWFMVKGARESASAAETARDTYKARAEEQAAGLAEARRVTESQRQTIKGLVSLWHSTRAEAERIAAETAARGKTIASLDRKLKEMTDAGADPADIALFNLDCLRRIEAGGAAAAGTCSD
jgi:hypothetical protein